MKLNYKRTMLVGFAFFLIQVFWQAYDNTIPLILTNKFGMNQTLSGIIMALDNILAIILLPIFGGISDKYKGKRGRRTPFILVGSIVAITSFFALSVVDNAQLKYIEHYTAIDSPVVLGEIYDEVAGETLTTPDGEVLTLSDKFTRDEFISIESTVESDGKTETNRDYTMYVSTARRALIHRMTSDKSGNLIFFIIILAIGLFSMSTFRSPAVALMPDVTIKPLRSKANAIINLMGSAGGITVLALGIVFATSALRNSYMSYIPYFGVISAIMIAALLIFMWKVKEPAFVKDMQEESRRFGITEDAEDTPAGEGHKLSKPEMTSLAFMLASIALWFMGYNAVTSKYSVFASLVLHKDYNLTLIIAQAAAILAYLPVGIISSKIGRKKAILAGVTMLFIAFGGAAFMTAQSPTMVMNFFFALAGIAWATINVNSFPMVVEMCARADIGKYTGFYYTASMGAQVLTPIISGALMDKMGMNILFPYAAIFTALAFMTMLMVRHGDSKPEAVKGLGALAEMED